MSSLMTLTGSIKGENGTARRMPLVQRLVRRNEIFEDGK